MPERARRPIGLAFLAALAVLGGTAPARSALEDVRVGRNTVYVGAAAR